MVTTLYLIRHGETEGSDVKRYKGSIDVPLSEKGVVQMERLSKYMVQGGSSGLNNLNGLSAVYCSPLSRALRSAEIIAKPFGIKPAVVPDLRERSFGSWEGMSFDEIRGKYPEEFKAWANNPLKFSPMQGENTLEVRDRVVKALDTILNNHSVQNSSKLFNMVQNGTNLNNVEQSSTTLNNIIVVAHGGVNRIMLCHLLGIPLENIFRIEQDFAALNIIEFWDDYPVVKLMNYTL